MSRPSLPRKLAALAALVLVLPIALADPPQNDAGLGGDAGHTKATATTLPGYGTYAGELRNKDNDWYVVPRTAAPVCVNLDAQGWAQATFTLSIRTGTRDLNVSAPLASDGFGRLSLAGSRVSHAWSGFDRIPNPAGSDPTRPGTYNFTLSESRAADATEGVSAWNDAGNMISGAFPVTGSCTAGRLQPLNGVGDTTDLWSFSGKAGQQIIYTLGATAPVSVQLVDAANGWAGPAISTDGIANVTLPTDGTYYMRTQAVGGSQIIEYVIGLIGPDPPPGNPCRPTCMVD